MTLEEQKRCWRDDLARRLRLSLLLDREEKYTEQSADFNESEIRWLMAFRGAHDD